jgi:hypothetical protein
VTLITLGSMVVFDSIVGMFVPAETTCGSQSPGFGRYPPLGSGNVAGLPWNDVRIGWVKSD